MTMCPQNCPENRQNASNMPTKVKPDVTHFGSLHTDDRKRLLLKAAQSGHDYSIGDFLGVQDASEVFVVDLDAGFDVATKGQAMISAAAMLGLHVTEPAEVHDPIKGVSYVVWCMPTEDSTLIHDPIQLSQETTADAALLAATVQLEFMVGSYVMPMADWFDIRGDEYKISLSRRRPRRQPTLGECYIARLNGTWVAAGVYTYIATPASEVESLKDEAIWAALEEPGSLRRADIAKRTPPTYEMRVVSVNGRRYAPFHDLVNAARQGVLVPDLLPYPDVNANRFVVHRAFTRHMRRIGWRLPWRGETPTKKLSLYGRTWVRDRPLDDKL